MWRDKRDFEKLRRLRGIHIKLNQKGIIKLCKIPKRSNSKNIQHHASDLDEDTEAVLMINNETFRRQSNI